MRLFKKAAKPQAVPEHSHIPENAHGERTSSYGSGYFAIIKYEGPSPNNPFREPKGTKHVVDLPLTAPLDPGWEFCTREEAHAFIIELEGFGPYSMFRLI
jgi:hypothetical protein